MILLDSNILLYAHCREMPHHKKISSWLTTAAGDGIPLLLTETTILSLFRIGSNAKILTDPLSFSEIGEIIKNLLTNAEASIFRSTGEHFVRLAEFGKKHGVQANLTMDAHLAVVALSTGATVATCDRDFKKFPFVKIINPVAAK